MFTIFNLYTKYFHEICFPVIEMTSKRTYLKYTLILLIYVSLCILCLMLKRNNTVANCFHSKNEDVGNKHVVKRSDRPVPVTVKKLNFDAKFSQKLPHLRSVSQTCRRYKLSTIFVKRHYLYSPNKSSLYCWIRKVASTSFTKLFSDSWNHKISRDYYKEVDVLSPKTVRELENSVNDDTVFKFLIVRHPFERIVSSYRDRLEDNTKYTAQAWIYARRIFYSTRPYLFHSDATSSGNSLTRIFHSDKRLKLVPTFKEFITWLLEEPTSRDDVHWNSYYSHCSVCDISYDVIMKLENNSIGEVDFIFSRMGLDKNSFQMPELEKTIGGFTDYKQTCSYFKTLTQDMILKLYQRYKIDFQMFDYKYENYLQCGISEI